jgi:hypothetical protein
MGTARQRQTPAPHPSAERRPSTPPYPPHPLIAAQLGVPGNDACHCPSPMLAMFCAEGHAMECHAGMTCEQAQCSHWERRQREDEDFG